MELNQIISVAVTVLVTAAVTAMIAALRSIIKRQSALEEGVQAILRGEIIRSHNHYVGREWITLHGLEATELAYRAYHDLGGNGTITKLVEDIQDLPVREEEEHT